MVFRKRILTATICILFFACKKDQNIDTPSVQITAPAGLQTFNVFDTITVSGHVSDPQGLKSVNIYLATDQSVQVLPTSSVTITSNDMNFTWKYILSDVHLASNDYYLTVSASNGTNIGHAYQKIYVDAAPTKRIALYAVTRTPGTVQTWKIDTLWNLSKAASYSGNYASSDISSYWQQFYVVAYDSGNANAAGVPNNTQAWSVPGNYSSIPFFTNVYSNGDAAYISFYSLATTPYVRHYDHNGMLLGQYSSAYPSYYPIKTFNWNGFFFAEEKDISSSAEVLAVYYSASTALYMNAPILPGPVITMYALDNNDVFVFGNNTSNGMGYAELYNIPNNSLSYSATLPSATILSAAQLTSNTFLIGFNNGNTFLYNYNGGSNPAYITGVNFSQMRYDGVNNQLVAASKNQIMEYSCGPSSGTLLHTITLPGNVLDVQILNNK